MFQDVAGIWKVLVREDFFMHQMEADAAHLCRSEPARDSSVSVSNYLAGRPLSRAGSLLQGICGVAGRGELFGTAQPLPVLEPNKDKAQLLGDLRLRRQMLRQGFGRRIDDVGEGSED